MQLASIKQTHLGIERFSEKNQASACFQLGKKGGLNTLLVPQQEQIQ